MWDFRQEEARKHWIEGWLQILSATISYTRKKWTIFLQTFISFFLPGALYPVTASNGGAGGVFLDGTGGSYHSQG